MAEVEHYPTPGGVENAIKDAAKKAAAADPSLDVNKRIHLEYFNRFLSRIFSEGIESEWVLKGGTAILARVPSTRSTRDIDLYREGFTLAEALADLTRLAAVDLSDHFTFQYAGHTDSIGTDTQPYTEGYQVKFDILIGAASKGSLQVDLVVFAATQDLDGTALRAAITTEARRRKMEPFDHFTVPSAWGPGYTNLAKPVPYCADYAAVDLAAALVGRLIDPALAGNADGMAWSHTELTWSRSPRVPRAYPAT